jgi:hypothetical protein
MPATRTRRPRPFALTGDEQADTDAFVEYVGGRDRADQLARIYGRSHPTGTQYDFLYGRGRTREQNFARAAKTTGFQDHEIAAFLTIAR